MKSSIMIGVLDAQDCIIYLISLLHMYLDIQLILFA